ncbi:MAG TPA: hypothetical protein VGM27_02235 [Acidobacteriaceae bacterium]
MDGERHGALNKLATQGQSGRASQNAEKPPFIEDATYKSGLGSGAD